MTSRNLTTTRFFTFNAVAYPYGINGFSLSLTCPSVSSSSIQLSFSRQSNTSQIPEDQIRTSFILVGSRRARTAFLCQLDVFRGTTCPGTATTHTPFILYPWPSWPSWQFSRSARASTLTDPCLESGRRSVEQ